MVVVAVFGDDADNAAVGEVQSPGGKVISSVVRPHPSTEEENGRSWILQRMIWGREDESTQGKTICKALPNNEGGGTEQLMIASR